MTSADDDLRERVLGSAQKYAESRGWPWLTPVEVTLTRAVPSDRQWTVKTNAFAVGRNARIVVREADMAVVDAGFLAR
jgi:hypothetical protein